MSGACIAKYGDWAWFKQTVGLRGWQGHGEERKICWLCQARLRGGCSAYEFSLSARWRSTMTTMSSFLEDMMKGTTHTSPRWSIPGFIAQYCVPDFMYTSCLGILQYLNGNVMWELFVELGGTYTGMVPGVCPLGEHGEARLEVLGPAAPFPQPQHRHDQASGHWEAEDEAEGR